MLGRKAKGDERMSSPFTGSLQIEEIEPGRVWKLLSPLRYEIGDIGSGRLIDVPKDFVTDGASIPPFARTFLAVWGTYGRAAVIHDYLYSLIRSGDPHPLAPTRARADAIFFEAMKPLRTAAPLRLALWAAVRVGGARYARNNSM